MSQYLRAFLFKTLVIYDQDSMMPNTFSRRIIVVSNRLPFVVSEKLGELHFLPSVGGLATGISSYLELLRDYPTGSQDWLWVGWPSSTISKDKVDEVRRRSLLEHKALPVFLTGEEIESFYQGFCNKTIWPLFHYFPAYATYNEDHWTQYVKVNRYFCRALLEILRPRDILWVHDYHLMLLPAMLREELPSSKIGFFCIYPFLITRSSVCCLETGGKRSWKGC
jgi:trehalose 6-phosphate synthase/phosphatase